MKIATTLLSILGLTLALSTTALAVTRSTDMPTPPPRSSSSVYFSAAFGAEYSRFQDSDFLTTIRNDAFAADAPTNVSETNTYDDYLWRFGIGCNFLNYFGVQVDLFTPFKNNYKATFTGTVTGFNFSDEFKYKMNLYDLLINLHYQLKNVPIIFSFKPGVALLKFNAQYTDTNTTAGNSRSAESTIKYVRPVFDLGIAYDFIRNQTYSNIIGFSWYHLIGSDTANGAIARGTGAIPINDIVKIPSINLWLLSYTLQFNT